MTIRVRNSVGHGMGLPASSPFATAGVGMATSRILRALTDVSNRVRMTIPVHALVCHGSTASSPFAIVGAGMVTSRTPLARPVASNRVRMTIRVPSLVTHWSTASSPFTIVVVGMVTLRTPPADPIASNRATIPTCARTTVNAFLERVAMIVFQVCVAVGCPSTDSNTMLSNTPVSHIHLQTANAVLVSTATKPTRVAIGAVASVHDTPPQQSRASNRLSTVVSVTTGIRWTAPHDGVSKSVIPIRVQPTRAESHRCSAFDHRRIVCATKATNGMNTAVRAERFLVARTTTSVRTTVAVSRGAIVTTRLTVRFALHQYAKRKLTASSLIFHRRLHLRVWVPQRHVHRKVRRATGAASSPTARTGSLSLQVPQLLLSKSTGWWVSPWLCWYVVCVLFIHAVQLLTYQRSPHQQIVSVRVGMRNTNTWTGACGDRVGTTNQK